MSTGFARDYHMKGEIAATKDGTHRGPEGRRARRPRRVQRDRPADEVPGRVLPHLHRLVRLRRRPLQGQRRLHEQGAGWRRLRLLVPRDRGRVPRRAHRRLPRGRARHGPGRAAHEEPAAPRAVPVHHAHRLGVRLGRLPEGAAARARHGRLPRAARRAGGQARARRVDGHRHLVLHRGRRGRPAQAHGHPRSRHGRRLRPAHPPHGQGADPAVRAVAGPGPRDDVRPDRQPRARHPARGRPGDQRRHRQHPVRPRHVRIAVDAGVGRGRLGRRPTRPREGPDHRRRRARVLGRRPRVGAGSLAGEGRPRQRQDDPGAGAARALEPRAARGRRGPPRRPGRVQPAEPHLPVRRLHLRRRHRPGHRRREGAAVHRRRRLRPAHQPDDRRGTGARRPRRRHRHGADGGHRVRPRHGNEPRRLVHGLPAAHPDGGARLSSSARPSRRRRTTRSAARASASRPPSVRRQRWSTP